MRKELIISSIAVAALIILSGSLRSNISAPRYAKNVEPKFEKLKFPLPDYRIASARRITE
ncbi:MAG TPA: hypothetical protein VI112_09620 [Bacteroidia bacterium]|jgi:hypothetical protein